MSVEMTADVSVDMSITDDVKVSVNVTTLSAHLITLIIVLAYANITALTPL